MSEDKPEAKENVESLFGDPLIKREVHPRVVEVLTQLLEEAEAGELIGFHAAGLYHDETTSNYIMGKFTYRVLGAVTIIQQQMAQTPSEDD